jgi:bifunctional DNA-binding transcriptional regulator/antitoxin component of YhaV-PrlF toxin-antitoxin module
MATSNGWLSERPGEPPARADVLVGKALLDKARALSNRPEDQIARACGYVGPSGRVLKKSFYRALVEAKGYTLPSVAGSGGAKGRQAEFRTRVHGNGNLLIGNAYTRRMGLEPGDEFRIELHRETGSIWLLPLEPGDTEAVATSDALDSDGGGQP